MSPSTFDGLLFGSELLLIPLAVALWIIFSADPLRRLIALQITGVIGALLLALLSIVFATESFADLAIAVALLGAGGGVAYAHFMERWL